MEFFNFNPRTDFHEMNLDWFFKTFKNLLINWDIMKKSFDDLEDVVDELKNYVKTYFDDLDVQEEINNKIDELVESGELLNLINLFNSHIRDTYGTYETATVDNVRNNNSPIKVNGVSDAQMAGYNFWDSVTRYTGYNVVPDSSGVRFTPSNCTLTECEYDFIDDSFVPLVDRVIFLFNVYTPTNLSDCYYGRVTSIDRLDKKFYVEKWYKHGDTSGTGYIPDATVYQYGIYNLKTHAYGDVCDITVNSNGDPVLGTVSGRQTNLWLDKNMVNNVTMDEVVVRSYDSDKNVIGYSVRDITDSAPVTAFYGGVGVNTILGSYYIGPILDRYGARYTNLIYEEDGTTNYNRDIVFSYGNNFILQPLTNIARDRHFFLVNNSNERITISTSGGCSFRMYGNVYNNLSLEPWGSAEIYYDYQTSNYNVLGGNLDKIVGRGNYSTIIRLDNNITLNPANFATNELKFFLNYTGTDKTVTITGYGDYTIPANSYKIAYFQDGVTFRVL